MRPVEILAVVLNAVEFGGWRDRTEAVYAQEVQSWHRRGRCILVPAAEAALWPWCYPKAGFSWVFPLQLPPQIHVCIHIWPRRAARGGKGTMVTAAVSFCGSVVLLSCPQGMGDSGTARPRGLRN